MISLNYRDARPIYEQVKDGLRKLIVTGAMTPDERLPSVRALATQLAINPNTIQRAYTELENEGYIYSVPGKGSFVASGNQELLHEEQLRITEGHLIHAIESARSCSLSLAQLQEMLAVLYEE